jgi:hypothetical protein
MGSRHPAAGGIAQQDRQAIGHHDGARDIWRRRHACVGLNSVWRVCVKHRTLHAMDLL